VTGDAELSDSAPLETVFEELAWEAAALVLVLVFVLVLVLVLALGFVLDSVLVLVLEVAGTEVFVVVLRALVGVLVAPCEPPAAITAQARAKVEMLAAATLRRVRAIRLARTWRSRSPRVVEAALVFDMGAT
jgi:hypothetical protein